MSLTDPIDCLPIPWVSGCLTGLTGLNFANWINLLTIDEIVAIWAKVENVEFTLAVEAGFTGFPALVDVSGTGLLDASDITPTDRICNTFERSAGNRDEDLGFDSALFAEAFARFRTDAGIGGTAPARAISLVSSDGDVRYSSPVSLLARAVISVMGMDEAAETLLIASVDTSALPAAVTATGTVNVAGVDLTWVKYRQEFGDPTGLLAEVGTPTASVTEWTFDGTINP